MGEYSAQAPVMDHEPPAELRTGTEAGKKKKKITLFTTSYTLQGHKQ